MTENKFIQVNKNALIEIIHDDSNYMSMDYSIITDTKNGVKSFSINDVTKLNNVNQQLFLLDKLTNKYAPVDFNSYNFLSKNDYTGNAPSLYYTIKIWFPINYNFTGVNGIYFNSYSLDYDNTVKYDFSNFYLDISNSNLMNSITLADTPIRMNNVLWGKYIELYIPNLYYESGQRINNIAKSGSINYNLTLGKGLSTTAPIYFDFRFLYSKKILLGETTYLTTSKLLFNSPQAPNNLNISVKIEQASDGDYFIINGQYNGSSGDLEQYMNIRALSGNPSYILYSITVYENNLPQSTRDIYIYENYSVGIDDYRPVIKYTNTLASIRVDMKIVSNDSSIPVEIRTAEYTLTGNEIAKYGKYTSTINVNNVIKPKLYNSAPVQVQMNTNDINQAYFKRKVSKKLELRYVSYPLLYNSSTIKIKNQNGIETYSNNELNIVLDPFDNIYKFSLIDNSIDNVYNPFEIPIANTTVNMVFKSDSLSVRIPLYTESNAVDLKNGVVVFKISEAELSNIKKISSISNNWYITLTTNSLETVLYKGTFEFPKQILTTKPSPDNGNSPVTNNTDKKEVGKLNLYNINLANIKDYAKVAELPVVSKYTTIIKNKYNL